MQFVQNGFVLGRDFLRELRGLLRSRGLLQRVFGSGGGNGSRCVQPSQERVGEVAAHHLLGVAGMYSAVVEVVVEVVQIIERFVVGRSAPVHLLARDEGSDGVGFVRLSTPFGTEPFQDGVCRERGPQVKRGEMKS